MSITTKLPENEIYKLVNSLTQTQKMLLVEILQISYPVTLQEQYNLVKGLLLNHKIKNREIELFNLTPVQLKEVHKQKCPKTFPNDSVFRSKDKTNLQLREDILIAEFGRLMVSSYRKPFRTNEY